MNSIDTSLDIIGNWDVSTFTPFGISMSKAAINSIEPFISGIITGEKGSLTFTNGKINNNVLTFSANVDTPIKATLSVSVEVIGDKFVGILTIDEYTKVNIRGQKNVNL